MSVSYLILTIRFTMHILIHFILFLVSVRIRYRAPLNSPIINVPLLLMNQVTLSHLAMPEAMQLASYYLVILMKLTCAATWVSACHIFEQLYALQLIITAESQMTIERSDGQNQTVIGYATLSPVQALINEPRLFSSRRAECASQNLAIKIQAGLIALGRNCNLEKTMLNHPVNPLLYPGAITQSCFHEHLL